ncbi:MAG TPA: CGNR zinc finger domain-containing protein [Candidatus Limnocylindrales bacterium]|nr:CGNR zinc finger domain-containing protein [Candidatus Limnocylindrales bacterium]
MQIHPHDTAHERPVLHSHLASLETGLDFINTLELSRSGPIEHIPTAGDALRWLYQHELLHGDMLRAELRRIEDSPEEAERTLRRIRRVRAAMREVVDATVERRPPDPAQLAELNRALRTHYIYELVPSSDGVHLGHKHVGDPVDGALARLAESIAREVSQGDPERLRICANETCRWAFQDTSRTGRRKWCDMATCGNRAKAARHRERQRQADGEGQVASQA